MKIIILEHLGDVNNWEWYQIYRTKIWTPQQAIRAYLKEREMDKQKIKKDKDGYWYAEYDGVRACYYDI